MEQHLPFYQQLKRERELRNLSQEELATKVGTDPKTVSRWESGERLPRSDSREALCKLFGKNAEELGLLKAEERRQAKRCDVEVIADITSRIHTLSFLA